MVKPEPKATARKAKRGAPAAAGAGKKYAAVASLAGAAGALPQPLSGQEMREIAWEDHALAKFGQEQ